MTSFLHPSDPTPPTLLQLPPSSRATLEFIAGDVTPGTVTTAICWLFLCMDLHRNTHNPQSSQCSPVESEWLRYLFIACYITVPWYLCEIPRIQIFMSEEGGNPVSICRSEMVELKCQIISQKDVSIFSCLTDLSACVRVSKKMAQPFGLNLRQNKEQNSRFLIRSPAPVYRCPFLISPVSPFGNKNQCTLWLRSPAEVPEIGN